MTWPKHYSLHKEEDKHYAIHDSRDNTVFNIAKKELHPAHQIKIMKMQKFSEGTPDVESDFGSFGRMDDNKTEEEIPDLFAPIDTSEREAAKEDAFSNTQGIFGSQAAPIDGAEVAPAPTEPIPMMETQAALPGAERVPQAMGQAAVPASGTASYSGLGDFQAAQSGFNQALTAEAQAKMAQNKEVANLYDESLKTQERDLQSFRERIASYQTESDEISRAIASDKIDPDRYWNSKDTGGKISTAIGVLLAGIGQGMQGSTRNMAIEALDKSIDRDIESQKLELGKKQTLLSDNFRKQGNLMAAEQATRIQMGAIVQGKMAKIAAQTNNPIIAAQAQQRINQVGMQMAPIKTQLAQYEVKKAGAQQALKSGNIGSMINYAVPPNLQKQAYEELGSYRHLQSQMGQVDNVLDDISKNNTISNRVMNPVQSRIAADQAQARLFPIVKAIVGERMTDADARTLVEPYVLGIMSNKMTVDKAKSDLKTSLAAQAPGKTPILTESLGPYGITFGGVPKSAGETKMKGGKPYRKVPGGWVPVGG